MNDEQCRYLANQYFLINLMFRIWDNAKRKRICYGQRQEDTNKQPFADYYKQQHNKKHKRKDK